MELASWCKFPMNGSFHGPGGSLDLLEELFTSFVMKKMKMKNEEIVGKEMK